MRQRPVLLITTVLAVLLVACGGVLVADAGTTKKIPEGVTIGGVDVGGLTADAARTKATRELTDRLSKPVRVVHSDQDWNLTAKSAGIKVDIDDAVAKAADLGDDGNAFVRVYHSVAGNEVRREFSPTSTYNRYAITRLLNRVEKDLHREPKSASVAFTDGELKVTKGTVGLRLKRDRVAGLVRTALLDPSASHQISAYTSKIQPKETTAAVRKKYGTVLVANRSTFKLTLYKNMKVAKTYGISVGKAGHDTPAGQYTIGNKAENPSWHVPNSAWAGSLAGTVVPPGPSNPIKARWLGIYDGVGIHGTSDDASIGTNASHGCLRMHVPDVIDLFPRVPVGTPIYIQ
ncbi:L,D-transpeptidase/peptidoglycan binding protein [Patulibacter sp.]|uniref:L,D-transpeptidase family protein n=1 Tax=Patulibacter sp. TaxID=1912859 RepID=UPI00271E155A|nr:L,D-transpeptidase/peptidoglycan binding protein [Patulibacter sp.]MDO9408557.1 L,D-transpeptidase/peptidoglycan binding protein [Patulibacter sp.]